MRCEELLSVPEVARLAGVSEWIVRRAIHAGELEAQRVGRAWAIRRGDAEDWIEALAEQEGEEDADCPGDPDDPDGDDETGEQDED